MRRAEIEDWALQAIEHLKLNHPNEDDSVEFKAEWPGDPSHAARQIAAHANAARGEPILWIIGVDQRARMIVGAQEEEFAVWWDRVKSKFDNVAPAVRVFNIYVGDDAVVALFFETDGGPFLVKNPLFDNQEGRIKYEVPWREGTSTRTATRSELIRLLVPAVHAPKIQVLGGDLYCQRSKSGGALWWSLSSLYLYVEPVGDSKVTFIFGRCKVLMELPGRVGEAAMKDVAMTTAYSWGPSSSVAPYGGSQPDSVTAAHTHYEMVFEGPSRAELKASLRTEIPDRELEQTTAIITAVLGYSPGERPVRLRAELPWLTSDKQSGWDDIWKLPESED